MEEKRKSVLETTKPSDALGRLAARHHSSHRTMLIVGALVFVAVLILIGLIFQNTIKGSQGIEIPSIVD